MATSEISQNKTQKEAFQESTLWYVHSLHRVKLTLHCPVWKLCLWGIYEGILSGAWRHVVSMEMSSNENWREVFWATALWCVYSSHRGKPFFGLSSLKSLFLWNLRKDIWDRSLKYAGKKYPPIKTRSKLPVKLLCVMWIQLTQLSFSFHWAVF